jgi:hypothetical protein
MCSNNTCWTADSTHQSLCKHQAAALGPYCVSNCLSDSHASCFLTFSVFPALRFFCAVVLLPLAVFLQHQTPRLFSGHQHVCQSYTSFRHMLCVMCKLSVSGALCEQCKLCGGVQAFFQVQALRWLHAGSMHHHTQPRVWSDKSDVLCECTSLHMWSCLVLQLLLNCLVLQLLLRYVRVCGVHMEVLQLRAR